MFLLRSLFIYPDFSFPRFSLCRSRLYLRLTFLLSLFLSLFLSIHGIAISCMANYCIFHRILMYANTANRRGERQVNSECLKSSAINVLNTVCCDFFFFLCTSLTGRKTIGNILNAVCCDQIFFLYFFRSYVSIVAKSLSRLSFSLI